jgi:hypothetical protein
VCATTSITNTAAVTGSNAAQKACSLATKCLPLPLCGPGLGSFCTVRPCRLVDTRNPAGPYGGPALAGGSERSFDLAGLCGIPPTAKAVSLSVTAVAPTMTPTSSGSLRLFQGGIPAPNTSAISFSAGQNRANNAVIGVTQDGHGTIIVLADMPSGVVDLVVDVNGYFQ